MLKEPRPMQEIHDIQKKISTEERTLSSRERIRKLHKEAAAIMRKYHLKTRAARKS